MTEICGGSRGGVKAADLGNAVRLMLTTRLRYGGVSIGSCTRGNSRVEIVLLEIRVCLYEKLCSRSSGDSVKGRGFGVCGVERLVSAGSHWARSGLGYIGAYFACA